MSGNKQNYNTGNNNNNNSNGYPSSYSITKPYGGMPKFMASHGLKIYNDDHVQEAKAIINGYKQASYESAQQQNNSNKK